MALAVATVEPVVDRQPPLHGRSLTLTPAAFLAAGTVILALRLVFVGHGFPLWGDYVPASRGAVQQLVGPWNTVQHGGSINAGINQEGWLALIAWLSGNPGTLAYDVVAKAFVGVSEITPFAVAMWAARTRDARRNLAAVPAAAIFAFNPWCLAQDGSGHFSLILGYSVLPICWRAAQRRDIEHGRFRGVYLASTLWLAAAFDLHMAVVAGIVLLFGLTDWSRRALATAGWGAGALASLTAYWWLPTVLATHSIIGGSSFASTSSVSASDISKLAALGDPYHVVGDRAFWWSSFSDGWYGTLASIALDASILLLLLMVGKFSYRIWVLLGLGTVPVMTAHYLPGLYADLVRLPGLGLFLDPSYWEAFYTLGLWAALTATSSRLDLARLSPATVFRQATTCLLLVSLASPFLTNRAHAIFRTSTVNDGELQVTTWLNHQHLGEVLWLPVVPYLHTSWSDGLVNDPERVWSTAPIANSYSESYYSTDPHYDRELLDLQNLVLGAPQDGATPYLIDHALVPALAASGIGAVVLRSDAFPPESARVLESTFATLMPVGYRSGTTTVYMVPGPRPLASRVDGPTLVPSGWAGLMSAVAATRYESRAYVESDQMGAASLLASPATSVISTDAWSILFGLRPPSVPAWLRHHATSDDFAATIGYQVPAGRTFDLPSSGVTSLAVVGNDSDIRLTCLGSMPHGLAYGPGLRSITNSNLIAAGDPAVARHWLAIACTGTVQAHFSSSGWLISAASVPVQQYNRRVSDLLAAMTRPGSGYVLDGEELVPSGRQLFSDYQNPLLLGSGTYTLQAEGPSCRIDQAEFSMQGGGPTTRVAVVRNAATLNLTGGFYQIGLAGTDTSGCSLVSVMSARPVAGAKIVVASAPSDSRAVDYPGPAGLAVFGPPGPWTVSAAGSAVVGLSADALQTWYAGGAGGLHSAPGIVRWSWVGPMISLLAIAWLVTEAFLRWRRRSVSTVGI